MTTTLRQVQNHFDCADPERLALFWCEVLGYEVPAPPPGFDCGGVRRQPAAEHRGRRTPARTRRASARGLFFQRVPEGKSAKKPRAPRRPRRHGDGRPGAAGTLLAEAERLEALGANRVRVMEADGVDESCIVMQDVEGNEFCLD